MYSKLQNVQILVALLKAHGIRHIVLSAGTRQVPLARCVENDPFFTTYSVVDERSAAYFAMGIAKELGEPVAISCTSSTATCNYLPAVAESCYQHVPLLVLTGDRDARYLGQMEDQMIPQVGMYTRFCKLSVDLPPIAAPAAADDIWQCERRVNEALLELRHGKPGPVQINYQVTGAIGDISDASVEKLPDVRKIGRIGTGAPDEAWRAKVQELAKAKRILVIAGLAHHRDPALDALIDRFERLYNCVVAVENISNVKSDGALHTYLAAESMAPQVFKAHLPDVVISFGGNFTSTIKAKLRVNARAFSHWLIAEDGSLQDGFKSLTDIFECPPAHFFRYFVEQAPRIANDGLYRKAWQARMAAVKLPEIPFSNTYAILGVVSRLPERALLHTGILNSTRIMEFLEAPKSAEVHSNIGTHGIDGSLSTFFGQSIVAGGPCYLVLGDLSFLYDMSSLRIRHVSPRTHILMVNNEGGAEFHFSMGRGVVPNIDQSISAGHKTIAEAWVKSLGYRYYAARDKVAFDNQIDDFMRTDHEGPVVFEVFTEKESDGALLKRVFAGLRTATPLDGAAKVAGAVAAVAPGAMNRLGRLRVAAATLLGKDR